MIFNRPDLTEITFQAIAQARPSKLLIVADGPRPNRPGESEKCAATRKIIERVNWDCEVLKNFSEVNLGCKKRVSSGITWAFEQVEEAIILEDDCVPDPSFFPFCDELLKKYRDNASVMAISGGSFWGNNPPTKESYYFNRMPFIWGWASWRRAWKHYDIEMKNWPQFRDSARLEELLPSWAGRLHYRKNLNRTFEGRVDTWDYQWTYSIWNADGICIAPTRNLIQNIGFGPDATHTIHDDPENTPPSQSMPFPLVHPAKVSADPKIDQPWLDRRYAISAKVKRRVRSLLKGIFK
jgi:hypothetical protein